MTPEVQSALITTPFGLALSVLVWRRWVAPWPAKVLIILGIMFLLLPGACMATMMTGRVHEDGYISAFAFAFVVAFVLLSIVVWLVVLVSRKLAERRSSGT